MSQGIADRLARLLQLAGIFEPLHVEGDIGEVHLFGRVSKERRDRWERFLVALLQLEAKKQYCNAHVCQRYLLKNDKLAYGWSLSITSQDLDPVFDDISGLLQIYDPPHTAPSTKKEEPPSSAPPDVVPLRKVTQQQLPSGEIITIETDPLPGVFKERVPNENGKGGYLIGSRDGNKNFRPPRR